MRNSILLCATALVTACGGGGSTPAVSDTPRGANFVADEVSSVLAGADLPSRSEFVGRTFPLRYATLTTEGIRRGRGSATVLSDDTILISRDGLERTFTRAGAAETFSAADGTTSAPFYDVIGTYAFPETGPGDSLQGYGFYGFETPRAEVPISGQPTYTGIAGLFVDTTSGKAGATGAVQLDLDFDRGTVQGILFDNLGSGDPVRARLSLEGGRIAGRSVSGALSGLIGVGTAAAPATMSGTGVEATFYGATGDAMAGTFGGSFQAGGTSGVLVGAFSAGGDRP